jgi:hypothetical protein
MQGFQKELYKFESLYKFSQRTCSVLSTIPMLEVEALKNNTYMATYSQTIGT